MTHISNMNLEDFQEEVEKRVSSAMEPYYGKKITDETLANVKYSVIGLLHTARQEGLFPSEININGVQATQDELDPTKVTIELPAKFLIFFEAGYDSLFPHFTHPPCDSCTFLAHYMLHDLYHCRQTGNIPTVIARSSSEPADYMSGIPIAKEMERGHPLRVAYRIAKDEGLPTEYVQAEDTRSDKTLDAQPPEGPDAEEDEE